jgi:hypothetical protein
VTSTSRAPTDEADGPERTVGRTRPALERKFPCPHSPVVKAEVIPQYGTQAGGSYRNPDTWWDPGDLRLVNAFYDADLGRLYTAHAVAANLRPDTMTGRYIESAIRWYEVEPAGRLTRSTLTRTGTVGAPEVDSGWPAVATDASGDLFMPFSRASKPRQGYLSAWAAEIPPGVTKAQLTLLTAGAATMESRIRDDPVEAMGRLQRDQPRPVDGAFVAMVNQLREGRRLLDRDRQLAADVRPRLGRLIARAGSALPLS